MGSLEGPSDPYSCFLPLILDCKFLGKISLKKKKKELWFFVLFSKTSGLKIFKFSFRYKWHRIAVLGSGGGGLISGKWMGLWITEP